MPVTSSSADSIGLWEATGLPHLLRIPKLALRPANLAIVLFAILATFLWGGLLDLLWPTRVSERAIAEFVDARVVDRPYVEPDGGGRIFSVWRRHQQRCLRDLLGASLPGVSLAQGTFLTHYIETGTVARPLRHLASMAYGAWWFVRYHFVYFLVSGAGVLAIWSLAGGAVCRIVALQFAREELLTWRQGLAFARKKLLGGFALAPCIPLIMAGCIMVLLALGGMMLRIPYLGDLLGGAAFFLALLGGFLIAVLLAGLAAGGHLFWPMVAADECEGFDAFSSGFAYVFNRPWKTLWYLTVSLVYAAICWLVLNVFAYLSLAITRSVVAFGTAPLGWWRYDAGGSRISKLESLWPMSGPGDLYHWPDTTGFGPGDYLSAVLIAFWVVATIGLIWAFLASFYFSACTVMYFLLRRDVDQRPFDEVYVAGEMEEDFDRPRQPGSPAPAGIGVSLPIVEPSSPPQ